MKAEAAVPKSYQVKLRCPHGDEERWITVEGRAGSLPEVLSMPWDFECALHGVQREIPMDGREVNGAPQSQAAAQPQWARGTGIDHRAGKRLALRVPLVVRGGIAGGLSFEEEATTIVVNPAGGLVTLSHEVKIGDPLTVLNRVSQTEQQCRVAYVLPVSNGRFRVGLAFPRRVSDFWKAPRVSDRMTKAIRVSVRGVDRNGNPFKQKALTLDVSRSGARLDGVGSLTRPGETVEVSRFWKKVRFRVVWVGEPGTPEANQVGVRSLEPEKQLWDASPSGS